MAGMISGKTRPLVPNAALPQDERGDQRRPRSVSNRSAAMPAQSPTLSPDVVGDGGGVARVVLGDALLDLADQVGADVGGLGEDAAADPHEHCQHGGAEAEALQHLRSVADVDQHHDRGAEQAEAGGGQPDRAAGPEGDLHGLLPAAVTVGRGGDPDVGPGGQPHAEVADRRGERRAEQESDGPADPLAGGVGRQGEQQREHNDDEDAQGAELPSQVGGRTFLDGGRDLLHLRGARARGEHAGAQDEGNDQSDYGDDRDTNDDELITTGNGDFRSGGIDGHRAPDPCKRGADSVPVDSMRPALTFLASIPRGST